ncbi:two-component system OmpR family response regulator [Undibacterium sp. GrIS 1.8]|uniref:response regulator n=1 Tax=unclassified Undibacterium TaxID=2630295 RepID=UPI0033939978
MQQITEKSSTSSAMLREVEIMDVTKKLKVFLIEDSQRIRTVLIDMLHDTEQIEVVGFAENEKDALKQLRASEWDVAIVDISLSEGNGLAVLAALQNDARDYGKRFVFTNHPTPALRTHSLKYGAEDFFDKSREMDLLVSRIRDLLH